MASALYPSREMAQTSPTKQHRYNLRAVSKKKERGGVGKRRTRGSKHRISRREAGVEPDQQNLQLMAGISGKSATKTRLGVRVSATAKTARKPVGYGGGRSVTLPSRSSKAPSITLRKQEDREPPAEQAMGKCWSWKRELLDTISSLCTLSGVRWPKTQRDAGCRS